MSDPFAEFIQEIAWELYTDGITRPTGPSELEQAAYLYLMGRPGAVVEQLAAVADQLRRLDATPCRYLLARPGDCPPEECPALFARRPALKLVGTGAGG